MSEQEAEMEAAIISATITITHEIYADGTSDVCMIASDSEGRVPPRIEVAGMLAEAQSAIFRDGFFYVGEDEDDGDSC